MTYYQVYQSDKEEGRLGFLVAPNDNRAGHSLLKDLKEGDVIFHYNSPTRKVFAISRVLPYDYAALFTQVDRIGDGAKSVGRPKDSSVAIIYKGRHLTIAGGASEHLIAKVETIREGEFGETLGPRHPRYLVKIDEAVGRSVLAKYEVT